MNTYDVPQIDELFDRRLEFPDNVARKRFARLVGVDEAKDRLTKLMACLVNPDGPRAWAAKFHSGATTLLDYLERRPPLVVLATTITLPLRFIVTWLVADAANLLTIHVVREGTQLMSADGSFQYDVVAACSGMHSLVAIFLLATVYGFVMFRSPGKRILFMALALPLSILGNFTRLMCVILAAELGGQSTGNYVHENWLFSLVPYLPAIAVLVLVGRWLENKSKAQTE